MVLRIIYKIIFVYFPKMISDFIKNTIKVKNISIRLIKNSANNIDCFYTLQFNNYCRKQIRFRLENWWIMHLHHIGLPPTINCYSNLAVSGNSYIKIDLKKK